MKLLIEIDSPAITTVNTETLRQAIQSYISLNVGESVKVSIVGDPT